MPSPSIPIEPSPEHLCRCGEPANWWVRDTWWRYNRNFDRDRFYCHKHHNDLLAKRGQREMVSMLKQRLLDTYNLLVKARRALRERQIEDPTLPELDPKQQMLDAGFRRMAK